MDPTSLVIRTASFALTPSTSLIAGLMRWGVGWIARARWRRALTGVAGVSFIGSHSPAPTWL